MWKQVGQKEKAHDVPGAASEEAQSVKGSRYYKVTQGKSPRRKKMFTHILKSTCQTRDSLRITTETQTLTSEGQEQ